MARSDVTITAGFDEARNIANGTKQAQSDIQNFAGVAKGAMASIGIALSAAALVAGINEVATAARNAEKAVIGLGTIAKAFGENQEAATEQAKAFAGEGLLSIQEAAQSLKNLISSGLSLDKATALIKGLTEQALFNRQAQYELGAAVVATTEGIRNENSIMSDATGTTENLFKMYERYAQSLGKSVNDLSKAEKAQAAFNGFMVETARSAGDIEKALTGSEGAFITFTAAVNAAKIQLGNEFLPLIAQMLRDTKPLIQDVLGLASSMTPLIAAFGALVKFAVDHRDIIAQLLVLTTIVVLIPVMGTLTAAIWAQAAAAGALALAWAATPMGQLALVIGAVGVAAIAGAKALDMWAESNNRAFDAANKTAGGPTGKRFQNLPAPISAPDETAIRIQGNLDKLGDSAKILSKAPEAMNEAEEALKKLNSAFSNLGITRIDELKAKLVDLNTVGTLTATQTKAAWDSVIGTWEKTGAALEALPPGMQIMVEARKAATEAAIQAEAAETANAIALKATEQSTEDAMQALNEFMEARDKLIRENQEKLVTKIILFFDGDVTRVKTASDLAVFSLGQVARALGGMSSSLNLALNVIEGYKKGKVSGGASGAIVGGGMAALSGILTFFNQVAAEAAAATSRLNTALERQIVVEGQLADLKGRTDVERIADAQKRLNDAQNEYNVALADFLVITIRYAEYESTYKNALSALIESKNSIQEAEIALINAQKQAQDALNESRRKEVDDMLATMAMRDAFLGKTDKEHLANLMGAQGSVAGLGLSDRRQYAQQVMNLQRQVLQEQTNLEIQGIHDAAQLKIDAVNQASQAEQAALNNRFDFERSLLRDRLAASFNIQSQALRLQFAQQYGASGGSAGLQSDVMSRFLRQAEDLQNQQDSVIGAEISKMQSDQESVRLEAENRRQQKIDAIEASKAERIEAFQSKMDERLVEIAKLLDSQLHLGLGIVGSGNAGTSTATPITIQPGGVTIIVQPATGSTEAIVASLNTPRVEEAVRAVIAKGVRKAGNLQAYAGRE